MARKSTLNIEELLVVNHGYVTTKQIQQFYNCTEKTARYAIQKAKLKKIARGVYCTPDKEYDEFYLLQMHYDLIYSHETALYLLGLIPKIDKIHATMKNGSRLNERKRSRYTISYVSKEKYEDGVIIAYTKFGNPVRVYNRERTLEDIAKHSRRANKEK